MGIPAHPLLVHAAVVLVPLQIAAALAYALVPFVRRYIAWFVVGIAVAAPLAAFAAKKSGEAFRNRKINAGGATAEFLAAIDQHSGFATRAFWGSVILAVLMLVMVAVLVLRSRRAGGAESATLEASSLGAGNSGAGNLGPGTMVLMIVLAVGVLGVGGATGYYIFKAGDTGAKMVWTGQ